MGERTLTVRPETVVANHRATIQRCGGHACPPGGCEESHAQRSATSTGPAPSPSPSALVDTAVRGPSRGLDPPTRAFMESHLGHDFSAVRIHDGPAADRSARAVAADAYTVGGDVVFAAGRYSPGTEAGRRTLAHELTHVVQQRTGPVTGRPLGGDLMVSDPSDRFEREAESVAGRMA